MIPAALAIVASSVTSRWTKVTSRFFTRPGARERHDPVTGERFARESVADLRAAAARHPRDAGIRDLVARLLDASAEFRRLWAEREVQVGRSTRKRIRHPQVDWLDLDCTAAPGTPAHHALGLLKVLGTQWSESSGPARPAPAVTSPGTGWSETGQACSSDTWTAICRTKSGHR
ncbi:hypothetical protein MXD60_15990 [Frankia sp. AgB32]|nr:hypothetical protein [Frankia sp. AgB32]